MNIMQYKHILVEQVPRETLRAQADCVTPKLKDSSPPPYGSVLNSDSKRETSQ